MMKMIIGQLTRRWFKHLIAQIRALQVIPLELRGSVCVVACQSNGGAAATSYGVGDHIDETIQVRRT